MFNTEFIDVKKEFDRGIDAAARIIKNGGVVAFPTETVYGLGADALNEAAVRSIFKAKGRPSDNPLIVHVQGIAEAARLAELTPLARALVEKFWPGPFTAVLKKTPAIPYIVTAGLDTVAVRMPDNRYALELIRRSGCPIAAPSANLSGSPSPTEARHVYEDLKGRIPLILDGGKAEVGLESTVCDLTGEVPVILRPGGVTYEMLREAAGPVRLSSGLSGQYAKMDTPPSPGMKYAHYAPKAQVIVVHAPDCGIFAGSLAPMLRQENQDGIKTVLLCTIESAAFLGDTEKIVLGSVKDMRTVARNLFAALRRADEMGADRVYFEALPETGMGLAVMNRIKKAAAYREIRF